MFNRKKGYLNLRSKAIKPVKMIYWLTKGKLTIISCETNFKFLPGSIHKHLPIFVTQLTVHVISAEIPH